VSAPPLRAGRLFRKRLDRAEAGNPDGWGALTDATARHPHLPNGLETKLAGADAAGVFVAGPDELAARARAVVEAADWFPGRRNDFTIAIALGEDPGKAGQLPAWLVSLVMDLGRAGLGAEAAAVSDALGRVAPDLRAFLDGDLAVALATAGLAGETRACVEANLARWPDDFWIRLHAGDALAILGDRDGAVAHFEAALAMAVESGDFTDRRFAVERLKRIGRGGGDSGSRPAAGKPPKRKKRYSAPQNRRKR
jgi:hypothetical protein